MATLAGTETEKNLLKSFAGESQARNRYDMFAKQARKEGYEQIAALFEETALNEQQHAKGFFRLLEGRDVEITATYPAGKVGTTAENLKASAMGEHEEYTELYPDLPRPPKPRASRRSPPLTAGGGGRGCPRTALQTNCLRRGAGNGVHPGDPVRWKCLKCGHIHEGKNAPEKCPTCQIQEAIFRWMRPITETVFTKKKGRLRAALFFYQGRGHRSAFLFLPGRFRQRVPHAAVRRAGGPCEADGAAVKGEMLSGNPQPLSSIQS